MKKITIVFILLIIFNMHEMKAQVTQEWVATYNGVGTGSNVPKKSVIDKLGNIIIAGRSENSSFNDDFITLKYNSSGYLLWEKRYNGIGNGDDAIVSAVLDDSNNIYVTGYSQEGAALGGYNWVTIKYFPNGDTAWKRSFNWTANSTDEPFAMAIDKLNNIYITGYGRTTPPVNDDMITIKYNSYGNLIWSRIYTSTVHGIDWGYSIATDDSNNVYTTGYGSLSGFNEIVTIKYKNNGDQKWIRKEPTNGGDFLRPTKSITDKFNNIIVNGYYELNDDYAFITIKYNSSGDTLWKRIYKGEGNLNFCFALCTDDSANIYAAGRNTSSVTGNDFLTIKYNQFGDTSWIRIYDSGYEQGDEVRSIVVDGLQNVYVAGRTDSTNGVPNYLTIKYDKFGTIKWVEEFTGGFDADIAYSICLDKNNNTIVTGNSRLNIFNSAIRTVKYSFITGIQQNSLHTNKEFSLFQNYPNPFNPNTSINYYISIEGYVKLKIYNSLGEEVLTMINIRQEVGYHNVEFNGNKFASGIYFYSLFVNGNLFDTKRMLLIK